MKNSLILDPNYKGKQKIGRFIFSVCDDIRDTPKNDMLKSIIAELTRQNDNLIQIVDDRNALYMNAIQRDLNDIVKFSDECRYIVQLFPLLNDMKKDIIHFILSTHTYPRWMNDLPSLSVFIYVKQINNADDIIITLDELKSFINHKLLIQSSMTE